VPIVTQHTLKSLLTYDAETGWFRWRTTRSNRRAGSLAGHLHPRGYVRIVVCKQTYDAHRLAWLYVYGDWPKGQVDHINRVKNDNRIQNLRCVTRSQNRQNSAVNCNSTTNIKGVGWHKHAQKWCARITIDGARIQLGVFESINDAIAARKAAETLYHSHRPADADDHIQS
jgi:hypothetical protein